MPICAHCLSRKTGQCVRVYRTGGGAGEGGAFSHVPAARRQPREQWGQDAFTFTAVTALPAAVHNQGDVHAPVVAPLARGHARLDARPEEALELLQPLGPLGGVEALLVLELDHEGVLAPARLFPQTNHHRARLARDASGAPDEEDALEREVQVLLVAVPVPRGVLA